MSDDFVPRRDIVMSALGAFAIQTHELFSELMSAGFNEKQAIDIVVGLAKKDEG